MSISRDAGRLLSRFVVSPVLDTAEGTQRARTLYEVTWGTFLVTTVFEALLVVAEPTSLFRRVGTVTTVLTVTALVLEVNRRVGPRLASWMLVGGLTTVLIHRAATSGGIATPVTTGFVILVLVAGLLLGTGGGIAIGLVGAASGFWMMASEQHGTLPSAPVQFTPLAMWLFSCLWIGLALVLQQRIAVTLREALGAAEVQLHERRQAERHLRLALDAGMICAWDHDLETGRTTAEPRLFDWYGLSPHTGWSLEYEAWALRVHPEDLPFVEQALHDAVALSQDQATEFRVVRPDGTTRVLARRARAVRDERGRPVRIVGVTVDITERKEQETERARLLHDLGERVKELRLLHAAAHLLRSDRPTDRSVFEELVALLPPAFLFPECCEARITFRDIVVTTSSWRESPWRLSATFPTSEGDGLIDVVYLDERPREAEGPFLAEERRLIESLAEMLVGYVELRKYQENLEELVETRTRELQTAKEEAERANRTKSTFLATMSHEIRTPMNAILGYAQVLQRDHSLNASQQQKIGIVLSSGDHLLSLINNVLEMSKIEAGRAKLMPAPVDLRALLEGVHQMFEPLARGSGLDLTFEAGGLPHAVEGDAGKIRQVVINLLSNATKFTVAGRIILRASSGARADGSQLVTIEVEDSGPGIRRDDVGRIFGVFEQSNAGIRAGGTGLGLTISRELARLMSGDLTVESELGVGSRFTFTFVAAPSASPDLPVVRMGTRPIGLAPGQRSRKVLLADDHLDNLEPVTDLLSAVGFEVRTARSGEESIEIHDTWRPDLVLMDVRMPGISGLETIRRLRSAGSSALFVIFTASGLDDLTEEARSAGAVDVLLKPYREADLLRRIGELLEVTFVYASAGHANASSESAAMAEATLPELLRGVPPNLVAQLRDAVIQARAARIEQLVVQISEYSMGAASQVRALARNFLYDELASVLERPARG